MTKRLFYTNFTILLLLDIGATYFHATSWQMIVRPSIILLLAFYYYQQIEQLTIPDYLVIASYSITVLAEVFYLSSTFQNFTFVLYFLFFKVGIVIYLIAREYRFYKINKGLFIYSTIFFIILSQIIAFNFNTERQYLLLECIFTAGVAVVFTMALHRKANKKSYEQVVIGIMTSAFSIILMSNNIFYYINWIDILARITHCMGLLYLTLGILNSKLMRCN